MTSLESCGIKQILFDTFVTQQRIELTIPGYRRGQEPLYVLI